MRQGYATLREQRIFATYLAKINPLNPDTRAVRFSFEEFATLCDIKDATHTNFYDYKALTTRILDKKVLLPREDGGITHFVLFEKCEIFQINNKWYFEITATQTAMPYFFEILPYFSYELQNALKLKSINQIRLYEILKQHEKQGVFDIPLTELRELLFIQNEEYPLFKDFKQKILEVCRKSINELTDISFTYDTKRVGRKIAVISFTVTKKEEI
jgi:plasmid replication initiation protein